MLKWSNSWFYIFFNLNICNQSTYHNIKLTEDWYCQQFLIFLSNKGVYFQIFHFLFQEIASKTRELINNLKSLSVTGEDNKQYITIEVLRERKMTPATENFLFSLAACEGLVQMWIAFGNKIPKWCQKYWNTKCINTLPCVYKCSVYCSNYQVYKYFTF